MEIRNKPDEKYFVVIDTETTWRDDVMSIGVAIADAVSFELVDKKYYILSPEYNSGGMYSHVIFLKGIKVDLKDSRSSVLHNMREIFQRYSIKKIFAYNALFDYKHLCELQDYEWFDIMKLAAYKQYNKKIPESAECCSTGRLKQNYGVEPVFQMLSGDYLYRETHNAVCDAVDELKIMKLLGCSISEYARAQINSEKKRAERL
jgi:hypothetical protein